MISAILDLQCFIEQILSSDCEVHQTSEALGCMIGAVNVDVYAAGGICDSAFCNESADNVLKIFDIFVLKNGSYNLATCLLYTSPSPRD